MGLLQLSREDRRSKIKTGQTRELRREKFSEVALEERVKPGELHHRYLPENRKIAKTIRKPRKSPLCRGGLSFEASRKLEQLAASLRRHPAFLRLVAFRNTKFNHSRHSFLLAVPPPVTSLHVHAECQTHSCIYSVYADHLRDLAQFSAREWARSRQGGATGSGSGANLRQVGQKPRTPPV